MAFSPAARVRPRGPSAGFDGRVLAVLGPTNTGKTHLAVERMLGHRSGVVGFPLRLLAREVFDRVRRIAGDKATALVTGEEKIVPQGARYFLCTVEAMPLDRSFDFLAIDEIQLAADRERGHIFTDRLLHARGASETMFLGSSVLKPLIARLVRGVEFIERPRLSRLTFDGDKKLTRLPPHTAVVAFSAAEVYAVAELIRRQRGGAAVVMGALSPRTRNAQVALFQSGDVDYLVATDAIGMGLNMDIAHVAFAGLSKFDGRRQRNLDTTELAQIAGRAGRHMSDGTFGTTAGAGPMDAHIVEAIESHRFPPARSIFWRNRDLAFRSLEALISSLDARAPLPDMIAKRDAPDHQALIELARDPAIRDATRGADRVQLLWEVAQIPDYRKESPTSHARLLGRIFNALIGSGRIDEDWAARSLTNLDRVEGDIDALTQRIEHVRTWRYIAHRTGWMKDSEHWQGRTRDVEDRLSDALHERLTQRFVDRRASVLMKRLKDSRSLLSHVDEGGAVEVEGHYVGHLVGLKFTPDASAVDSAVPHRAVRAASARALAREIPRRVREIVADADSAFALDGARIVWKGAALGELTPGRTALNPEVTVFAADGLSEGDRQSLRRRLDDWVGHHVARRLAPLVRCADAAEDPALSGHGRAIVHRVVEGLGLVPRAAVTAHVDAAPPALRKRLAALGIRIGRTALYLPALKDPALRILLASLHHRESADTIAAALRHRPAAVAASKDIAPERLHAAGYLLLNSHAVRIDVAERLAASAAMLAHQGPFAATPALSRASGLSQVMLPPVLKGLGYAVADRGADGHSAADQAFTRARKRPRRGARPRTDSPFAKLADLVRRP
ncbi:MAG TPA: helicase-related protein [Alphaproteobacteria bacterium]|jgi:ATP-dependent RNA helicase SUPV3L1/SUV3|nr:helicase-related protein [Alphaproteobacteria bacterium]